MPKVPDLGPKIGVAFPTHVPGCRAPSARQVPLHLADRILGMHDQAGQPVRPGDGVGGPVAG
jgi:hypothetical protein